MQTQEPPNGEESLGYGKRLTEFNKNKYASGLVYLSFSINSLFTFLAMISLSAMQRLLLSSPHLLSLYGATVRLFFA